MLTLYPSCVEVDMIVHFLSNIMHFKQALFIQENEHFHIISPYSLHARNHDIRLYVFHCL